MSAIPDRTSGAVRLWLAVVAALVIAMVAVGGATRLTGSGLSITEWRPVTGALPPLSDADWAAEFAKYRDTPQYNILNQGMGLSAFKVLYGWEWGHRFLGRLLGFVFFLPLIVFWWKGMIRRRLGWGLLGLGLLGGLQGAIGWIMVASGLQPGMTAVAPLKLALHLTTASLILALLVWLAAGERPSALAPAVAPARHRPVPAAAGAGADLPRRLGRGLSCRARLQHVARHGRRDDPRRRAPVRRDAVDRELRRQPPPRAVRPRVVAYLLLTLALLHAADAVSSARGTGTARRPWRSLGSSSHRPVSASRRCSSPSRSGRRWPIKC